MPGTHTNSGLLSHEIIDSITAYANELGFLLLASESILTGGDNDKYFTFLLHTQETHIS